MMLARCKLAFWLVAIGFLGGSAIAQELPEKGSEPSPAVFAAEPERNSWADLSEFRRIALEGDFLPKSDGLPIEALLAEMESANGSTEHLPVCHEALCLKARAIESRLETSGEQTLLVGLDVARSSKGESARSQDLAIIVVLDRSGSMKGAKRQQAMQALQSLADSLSDTDQLALVSFGEQAELTLPLEKIGGDRDAAIRAAQALPPVGHTNLLAGLQLGLGEANRAMQRGAKDVRLVMLTDQHLIFNRSIGNGLYQIGNLAGQRGIAFSVIGIHQFPDTVVAQRLAAFANGRLIALPPTSDGASAISVHSQDLIGQRDGVAKLTLDGGSGYRVKSIYGVPPELVEQGAKGRWTINLGRGFISDIPKTIYFALAASEGDADKVELPSARLTLVSYAGARLSSENVELLSPPALVNDPQLAYAAQRLDFALTVRAALDLFHLQGKAGDARAALLELSQRMSVFSYREAQLDRSVVTQLAEKLKAKENTLAFDLLSRITGRWTVAKQSGLAGLRKGDVIDITPARELVITRRSGSDSGAVTRQTIQLNGDRLLVDGTDLEFDLKIEGDRLELRDVFEGDQLLLRR